MKPLALRCKRIFPLNRQWIQFGGIALYHVLHFHCKEFPGKHRIKHRTGYEEGAVCSGRIKAWLTPVPCAESPTLQWDDNAATAMAQYVGGAEWATAAPPTMPALFLTPQALNSARIPEGSPP